MPGKWNLPGGGIEEGESPQLAAVRECEEEAGLTPTGVTFYKKVYDPGFTLYLFKGKTTQEPHIDFESDGYAWVALQDLKHYQFVPHVGEALASVLSQTDVGYKADN